MKKNVLVPTVLCLALAIVAVAVVLITKTSEPNKSIAPENEDASSSCNVMVPSVNTDMSTKYANAFLPTMSTAPVQSKTEATVLNAVTAASDKVITTVQAIKGTIGEHFILPQAPKYNPASLKINLGTKKILSYRYNEDKNYYYTDDKDCWQSNFGFNKTYDVLAPLGVMYYQTVRTAFNYGGKSWRIQIWKGQYGTAFVGGEIGLYTQDINETKDHYVCAAKEDWLNMEMTLYWDSYITGNYFPVLTRPYDKYWWCTGFVAGFEDDFKDHTDLRLVARITFKNTEMASAFCEQFEKNGFRRASRLNVESLDSFIQVGPDVAFVWQNLGANNT